MKKYSLVLIALAFLTNMLSLDAEAMRRTVRLRNRGITSLRDPRLTRRLREGVRVVDLANLTSFVNGEIITRNPNTISSFDGIEDFPSTVEEIILFGNQIGNNDLQDLNNAPVNLKVLDLGNNQISQVDNFPILPNLEELLLSFNGISDIANANFSNIASLKILSLLDNSINAVSSNALPDGLEKLFIGGNNLLSIDLSSLEDLQILSLGPSNISDISSVVVPQGLQSLSVITSEITSLEGTLPESLIRLNLAGNQITNDSLENFTPPNDLCSLDLSGNPINFNASNLQVSQLQNLKVLDMERTGIILFEQDLPESMQRLFLGNNATDGVRRQIRRNYRQSNPQLRIKFRPRSISRRAIRRLNALCGL